VLSLTVLRRGMQCPDTTLHSLVCNIPRTYLMYWYFICTVLRRSPALSKNPVGWLAEGQLRKVGLMGDDWLARSVQHAGSLLARLLQWKRGMKQYCGARVQGEAVEFGFDSVTVQFREDGICYVGRARTEGELSDGLSSNSAYVIRYLCSTMVG
jgi:hypothetical protein